MRNSSNILRSSKRDEKNLFASKRRKVPSSSLQSTWSKIKSDSKVPIYLIRSSQGTGEFPPARWDRDVEGADCRGKPPRGWLGRVETHDRKYQAQHLRLRRRTVPISPQSQRYSLKGNVQKTNTNARGIGFGVNDMVFDEMDRGFYKYMPQGNKEAIFDKSQRPKSISKERVLKKSATVASRMTFKQRMKWSIYIKQCLLHYFCFVHNSLATMALWCSGNRWRIRSFAAGNNLKYYFKPSFKLSLSFQFWVSSSPTSSSNK